VRYSYAWIKGAAGPASRQQVGKFTAAVIQEMKKSGVAGMKLGVDFVDINMLAAFKERGKVVAEIPTGALTDAAPVYNRPMERPAYLAEVQRLALSPAPAVKDAGALRALLISPTIASKRWVYRQYDHMVRTNTVVLPGMGAGVVRIKETSSALALSVDGNGRYCYLDPYRGAMLAVAEAARNVACAGGEPIGATNCLNFGNPERPEIMWQFARAVEGIAAACEALSIPITGGNVSLYNETDGRAIYPTPGKPVSSVELCVEYVAITPSSPHKSCLD